MPKLRQFTVQIFVYSIETFLEFFFSEFADRVMSRIVVDVRK
jgi:hypothetical protein